MASRVLTLFILIALCGGSSILSASAPALGAVRCEEQIRKALSEVPIEDSDIESIQVRRSGGGGRSSSNYSLDAWIRLKSCSSGYLMVALSSRCHVQDTYTKGGCQVSGL